MKTIRKIYILLTPPERKRAGLLLGMILVMAMLDMLGVASILPFIAVLANPDLVQANSILNDAYRRLGFIDPHRFLLTLGILVFVLLVVSLAFKALTTYIQLRFVLMCECSIGKRLLQGYLYQPYSWFLGRHSADLGKTILSEVSAVINQGFMPMMNLIAQSTVATTLLILLFFVDSKLALIVGLALACAYALILKANSSLLARIGVERFKANQRRFTAVSEAFGAAKEVKVGGLEDVYIQRFSDPANTFAHHQATAQIISQLPRYAVEAIAFGGMLLVILYLMVRSGNLVSALPIIALYAFAGYRLMPALQQIYGAITVLRFVQPALDVLHGDLVRMRPEHRNSSQNIISLKREITLKHIHYRYPNSTQPALKNLSLIIPSKSIVGFVGSTGSGKTTTVDLILGLLESQEGTLAVDGQIITEYNKHAWQRGIGYVPQQIFLTDDTIAANIAFGHDAKDINQEAVERAAKIAELHEFVVNNLPQKYQTIVGERGVRLSGGQRQRIGIARALYHNPQVLILDEATSSLDNLTEQAVMKAVQNLGREITIILIAHRLSTVKACDNIFLLEMGELKAQGTFDELMQRNENFRSMAII